MRISPFSPIYFFNGAIDDAIRGYMHIYSPTDRILIEVFHLLGEEIGELILHDADKGDIVSDLTWNTVGINASDRLSFYELRDLLPGCYILTFGKFRSLPIYITSEPNILNRTVLIQYAMRDNRCRKDIISWIGGNCRYHDFRISGGFKDNDWKFLVENEQFLSDEQDIVEIDALEYTEKLLTIGSSSGVPIWVCRYG